MCFEARSLAHSPGPTPPSHCLTLALARLPPAAINWVIKDGAGRMGRFLFARIGGRSLDDKAKQWRLLGDGLMFSGMRSVGRSLDRAPCLSHRAPHSPIRQVPSAS